MPAENHSSKKVQLSHKNSSSSSYTGDFTVQMPQMSSFKADLYLNIGLFVLMFQIKTEVQIKTEAQIKTEVAHSNGKSKVKSASTKVIEAGPEKAS